jgi:hypothetical protein
LLITNGDFIDDLKYEEPIGNSDHIVVKFQFMWNDNIDKLDNVRYCYDKGDYDKLRRCVSEKIKLIAVNDSSDVEDIWRNIKEIIYNGMKECIPVRKINIHDKKVVWRCQIDNDLKKDIKRKHRLWTRYMQTRNEKILVEYKVIRNKVKTKMKQAIINEQKEIAYCSKTNPKKFWKYVSGKSHNNGKIGTIKIKNEKRETVIVDTDECKCNAFVDYFTNVFNKEPDFDEHNVIFKPCDTKMEEFIIDNKAVLEKLKNLKIDKSPGVDDIHPRVLKELSLEIVEILTKLFNLSLKTSNLPEDWKLSIVTALFKKGSRSEVSNYRPVSLTCIVCKILESIITEKIMSYLLDNKLLSNKQFGFIKGRSTSIQLLTLLDKWSKHLDNSDGIDVIYTDFEKAFDKVPHNRLIFKIKKYGICQSVLKWITAYLRNRKHKVRLNNRFSEWKEVISGIPQGSVLGPILFVLYINDMPAVCDKIAEISLFADDAKISKILESAHSKIELQNALNNVVDWSKQWLLSLNIIKCVVLNIRKHDVQVNEYNIEADIGKTKLNCVESVKDLGVIVDKTLSFKEHITEKIKKANSMLGLIKRNFKYMDEATFIMLYKSLVRSHLEYASSVWCPYRRGLINEIEKIQKRATKLIPKFKNKSYSERLKILKLPTLVYRRYRGDMIETYKILTNKYDKLVAPVLELNQFSKTRGHNLKLKIQNSNNNIRKYSFCVRVPKLWNSLSDNVINSNSVNAFKNNLDKYWSNQDVLYDYKANTIA